MATDFPTLGQPNPPASDPAAAPMPAPAFKSPAEAADFFKDPEALRDVAQIFLKNGMPEGLHWLERGHMAAKENAFEAAQHLLSGDGEAAVKAWNKSGRFNDAEKATKNANGTWTITRKGGKTIDVDPEQQLKSFMSPTEYFKSKQDEQAAKNTKEYHDKNLTLQSEQNAAQREYQQGTLKNAADQNAYQREYQQGMLKNNAERIQAMLEKASTGYQHAIDLANAKAEGAKAKAEVLAELEPVKQYWKTYTAAVTAGNEKAAQVALAGIALDSTSTTMRNDKDGTIAVFTKGAKDPFITFKTAADYKAFTGIDVDNRLPPGATAAPVPGAAPGTVPKAAPARAVPTLGSQASQFGNSDYVLNARAKAGDKEAQAILDQRKADKENRRLQDEADLRAMQGY